MGQAKQRGTFEQRQAEGIAKRQERERLRREATAAREVERAEREASKTPEERDRSRRARMLLLSGLGWMIGSSNARGKAFAAALSDLNKEGDPLDASEENRNE